VGNKPKDHTISIVPENVWPSRKGMEKKETARYAEKNFTPQNTFKKREKDCIVLGNVLIKHVLKSIGATVDGGLG